MSEKEIRELIHNLCSDIDRRARQAARGLKKAAMPVALGAGLALSAGGCSDDTGNPPPKDGQTADTRSADGGPAPAYAAPPFEMGTQIDLGGAPAYAVPGTDLGPPTPDYMAPGPDAGPQPDYMAPGPDGGK